MKSERQKAIARADHWFSRYIRLKYSHDGICFCYITGKEYDIKEIDCGHFISRSHFSTRWHEDNARPQSVFSNKYRNGDHAKFRQKLVIDLGKERVEKLESLGAQTVKFTTEEIREASKYYLNKFNNLVKEKGNPWKS